MRNIILIGFMGAGKSAVARSLAKNHGFTIVDTDQRIEEEQGMKISDIFKEKGEEYFRSLETDLLTRLAMEEDLVISCGGGMALREENRKKMKECGTVIWLQVRTETVLRRIRNTETRPLLHGKSKAEITELMKSRESAYEAASDLKIQTDPLTPYAIGNKIAALVKKQNEEQED